ncbi:hypothetical protein [Actinoplanes solisilvae]|uniref:hypothetical protein n=1 Tax=Actinoplanes solisilvae TaxID=2486853 RepID=UPI000FDB20A7|nr:hypothetical protein [Actinoplanes solisilvae]
MRVLDVDGETVGRIIHVTTGDALTEPGRVLRPRSETWAGIVLGDQVSDLDGAPADRLMSGGYLKVLGTGLEGVDCYVAADQIAEVADDTVLPRVGRGVLLTHS